MVQAVKVLKCLNWNSQQNETFVCLILIIDHLLTMPLTQETEGNQL